MSYIVHLPTKLTKLELQSLKTSMKDLNLDPRESYTLDVIITQLISGDPIEEDHFAYLKNALPNFADVLNCCFTKLSLYVGRVDPVTELVIQIRLNPK